MKALDPATFEPAVRPTDDFFLHVNGKWIKENPIPPEEARWGSFTILNLEVENRLKAIVEEMARGNFSAGTAEQKVRDFYLTAMDMEKLNALKTEPVGDLLQKINDIKNKEDLAEVSGTLHRSGFGSWWHPSVEQDEKRSTLMTLHLYQAGLGLPDRDYYLNDDKESAAIRSKYKEHILNIFKLADRGVSAEKIMEIETALAKASRTRVELRDVLKQYNKMSPAELQAITPNIKWDRYFASCGVAIPEYLIVGQPEFFEEVNRLWEALPLDDIKEYFSWQVLNGAAVFLGKEFEEQYFDFYDRNFKGAKEMKPRWRRVLGVMNWALDEILGKLYVERHFDSRSKERIRALVEHLIEAYRIRIKNLDWMSAATKEKALVKLSAITKKLGYPEKWKDTEALVIKTDSYAANYRRAFTFEFDRQIDKVGKPVDKDEWYMPPQTVNACYNPTLNEILFPAAILQPPFFYPDADDAVNFGGIGTIIGHEMTHGFDDQGAKFDEKGNMENWWTDEDKKLFSIKGESLAKQFDEYEPLPGEYVNGKLTLGENIADLGGIMIAYDGLLLALKKKPQADIDGLSPEQRFFANLAVIWRSNRREELARLSLKTDPHSPPEYRVNGPLSNFEEFYKAFACRSGDRLWRPESERVKIW